MGMCLCHGHTFPSVKLPDSDHTEGASLSRGQESPSTIQTNTGHLPMQFKLYIYSHLPLIDNTLTFPFNELVLIHVLSLLVQIIFHLIFLDNKSYFICMAYEESLMSIGHFHCYHHSMAWVHYCGAIWGPKGLKSLKFWSCLYFYMTFFFYLYFKKLENQTLEPNQE